MFPRTVAFMLFCAGIGYFLGRSRGMGLQGLCFGLAFGPLGWALILLWPRSWVQGPVPRQAHPAPDGASGAPFPGASGAGPGQRATGPLCPRCQRPVGGVSGACPHCGNVLVPIRYAVEDGDPRP